MHTGLAHVRRHAAPSVWSTVGRTGQGFEFVVESEKTPQPRGSSRASTADDSVISRLSLTPPAVACRNGCLSSEYGSAA